MKIMDKIDSCSAAAVYIVVTLAAIYFGVHILIALLPK